MPRPSLWLIAVILLLGVLFLREPALQKSEGMFLQWLLRNSVPSGPAIPLTVIEIERSELLEKSGAVAEPVGPQSAKESAISPLEYALFLQSALAFQPTVVAFENILRWRDRDRDQEQVFLDQAMRVPRLLLAAELTSSPEPDAIGPDVPGFTNVTGKRTDLVEFSGVVHQSNEDMRLISSTGFVNLPDEITDDIHVPLLFLYRGEVIPSFALQAAMLWLRVTPAEAKIELGKRIVLPQNRSIPIASDGTLLLNPNVAKRAHHLSLGELLLAAQERDQGVKPSLETLRDQIVLARTPSNPLSPPDVFAATIATIASGSYVRRVSWIFDCVVLVLIAFAIHALRRVAAMDLFLGAIAVTAAYCLAAIAILSRWQVWLPGFLPIGALWLALVLLLLVRNRARGEAAFPAHVPPPII